MCVCSLGGMNAFRLGKHSIHFQAAKRLVRKRFVSRHQQDISLYPQIAPSSPRQTVGEIRP